MNDHVSHLILKFYNSFSSITISSNSMLTESVFYSLKAERPSGEFYNFSDLKGKTVLIVNVASEWYVTTMYIK